ncbi:condensation domain-containing protein, partial [Paraburkholderia flava]|uniref:condensation domain-containing protein n=1 Tax=Paraburkholderia flava TaxID=2547393 RepID=UPI001414DDB0
MSLPLSPAQEGLWFMQRLEPLSTAYHLARAFHLRGPLDVAALEQALNVVRARQAVLRTCFIERDGQPLQVAGSHFDVRVPMSDLSVHVDGERDAALSAALAHERQQPFDLAADGAARLCIFRMSADWHVLSVVVHHLVSDGGSNAIFARELADAYGAIVRNEASTARPALTWQYADFAGWQRAERTSDKGRADLAWWTGYLGARQDVFELPADFVRTAASERTAHTHTFTLKDSTVAAVRARCKAERCTSFVALMAAWQLLLSRHSGRDDFCIGVPTSGRLREECEELIGLFVDTQVYRARLHPSMTGRALLDAVRSDTRAALDHNGVTLAAVVDALGVRREADRHPLFQTLFNVQGASAAGALSLEGLDVEIVDFESPAARFDLSFDVRIAADAVTCTARYDSSLYHAETIARLGRHYEALLVGLCDAPERAVAGIEFIDEDELAQLSVWSASPSRYEPFAGVHELFSREALRHPSAVALVYGEAVLTYAELESRANRLAHFLIGRGVGPEVRVGIGVERSVEMVVGLLAILKAGGAYVPLDPEYPAER